ncbi:MAG TPA: HEAT repeat domain-containing protein, partial [Thermodesulfobacteriota bacterium]
LVEPHLHDDDRDIRIAARLALRTIGDRRFAPLALAGLDDEDPALRGASAALLAALGPSPDEADRLLARAADPDFEIVRALRSLARRPTGTLPRRLEVWLPGALTSTVPAVRRTAALLLEAAPDAAHRQALETLRADLAPAPFATSGLDAWRAERGLPAEPDPAAAVATVAEAAGRALAALARRPANAPRAARYGWDVLFAYRRLPPARDVAAGTWPGLDPDALDVTGTMNPAGRHWTMARMVPRARGGASAVWVRVVRRDAYVTGRLAFEPDPRIPTLETLDAKLAARPGADAVLLVDVTDGAGRRADADRAAEWLAQALSGLATGPWVWEPGA